MPAVTSGHCAGAEDGRRIARPEPGFGCTKAGLGIKEELCRKV